MSLFLDTYMFNSALGKGQGHWRKMPEVLLMMMIGGAPLLI